MKYTLFPTPETALPIPTPQTDPEARERWWAEYKGILDQANTDVATAVALAREFIGVQTCAPADGCRWCAEQQAAIGRLEQAMMPDMKRAYMRRLSAIRRSR